MLSSTLKIEVVNKIKKKTVVNIELSSFESYFIYKNYYTRPTKNHWAYQCPAPAWSLWNPFAWTTDHYPWFIMFPMMMSAFSLSLFNGIQCILPTLSRLLTVFVIQRTKNIITLNLWMVIFGLRYLYCIKDINPIVIYLVLTYYLR